MSTEENKAMRFTGTTVLKVENGLITETPRPPQHATFPGWEG